MAQCHRVLVAHDYFTQLGGAERVALAIHGAFPDSPLLTSVHLSEATHVIDHTQLRTLWPDRWTPLRHYPRRAAPLLALAWAGTRIRDADVVVASTSSFAHWLHTRGGLVVYCHTPARWLYAPQDGLPRLPTWAHPLWRFLTTPVRRWDGHAARRADVVLANSTVVAERIHEHWGVKAQVLFPPPGVDADGPQTPVAGVEPGYLLTIGRARSYKNVDAAVEAVRGLPKVRLVCVGSDPAPLDPPNVTRLRGLEDSEMRWLYAHAAGLIALAHEDFGLTPVEAQSFGVPTLALRADGYLDSTTEGVTGVFVDSLDAASVQDGIERLGRTEWYAEAIRAHGVRRFGLRHFEAGIQAAVQQVMDARGVGSRTRPRVLFINHIARLSGGELALLRTIKAFGDRVDVTVVLGEDGPLRGELEAAGAQVIVLTMDDHLRDRRRAETGSLRAFGQDARSVVAYVRRLRALVRQLNPDVVHGNSLKSCLVGGLAGRLAGTPVVWHVRDHISDEHLPARAVTLVRLASLVLPTAVVANSTSTLDLLPPQARRRGRVVGDSVDLTLAGSPQRGEVLTVGIIGRISPWKGQDVFLRAFADAFPGGPERARVVGSVMFGEEDHEAQLRDLAEQLGIADRVEWRGFRSDIWAELAELDVLVHASTAAEPFGQVVIEGMAAGRPVIAAAEGGPLEVVTDDVDGLLVAPRDVAALSAALQRLAADPELRQRLGAAGMSSARAHSPENTAGRLLSVYASLE